MIVKCGRREFELDENDEILFNGACYVLTTKKYLVGFDMVSPTIAKNKAKKMIKDGDLIFKEKRKSHYFDIVNDIYKVNK